MFTYYQVDLKLLTPMLGTATEASIWKQHVLEKTKKEIAKLNKITTKITKAAEKYGNTEITNEKEIAEIKGCIRATEEALGKKSELPDTLPELIEHADALREEFETAIKAGQATKATVFMRNKDGKAVLSTHMILGNLKENMKIVVNNSKGDKIYKSKVGVSEVMALDVKFVDQFITPTQDILRGEDGKPVLLERPIRFQDNFGNTVTAIAMSEQLPEGTEMSTVIRARADSLVDETLLTKLFDLGKSNGLGAWRGSGNKGSYAFRLKKLDGYKETLPQGWN